VSALALVVTLAAWLAPSSSGSPAWEDVTLTVTQVCLLDTPTPTFEAQGAIDDSGEVDYTFLGPPAGQYGITGRTIKTEALFTGADGTLTLRWDVVLKASDDPNIAGEFGQWRILSATGDYAGMTGEGRSSGFCDLRSGPQSEIQILEGRVTR
jgi:hypothetical protein